jgi:hypothetical protein
MESIEEQTDISTIYLCPECNYQTKHKHHFNRHILTDKHIKNHTKTNINNNNNKQKKYICECGKSYFHKSGLCKHKNNCDYVEPHINDTISQHELISILIDQNQEFKQMMIDQNKKIVELVQEKTVYNDNSTNNHNSNHFNLNVYLNVTCKDAINMSDFLDSINLQLDDLEQTGKLGYVDGISKIFIDRLNELNIHDRPMCCSDLRREVIYVKNNNVWKKETNEREELKSIIKSITHKNMGQILVWQDKNPGWDNPSKKINDVYLKIVSNSMGGTTEEEMNQNYDKIISRVAREIVIQKRPTE